MRFRMTFPRKGELARSAGWWAPATHAGRLRTSRVEKPPIRLATLGTFPLAGGT